MNTRIVYLLSLNRNNLNTIDGDMTHISVLRSPTTYCSLTEFVGFCVSGGGGGGGVVLVSTKLPACRIDY